MQEYLHRSRFASAMDELGFHMLAMALSAGWFCAQWGLRLPSLTAGAGLYGLILLIRRKTREDRLRRKEERLRARLGGEMALERLLMLSPARAHFEAAMLLSLQKPMELLRTGPAGVLCKIKNESVLISFAQSPPSSQIGADQVLSLQREARAQGAVRAALCAPCPVSPQAREQAEGPLPVSFIPREDLIRIFGRCSPATDRQLVELGKRRKKNLGRRFLRTVLDPRRARTLAWYGALLLLLYAATNQWIYAFPGLACAFLSAFCRCNRQKQEVF